MCAHSSAGLRDDVIDEHTLEAGHVADPGCIEKGFEQAVTVPRLNRLGLLPSEVYPSSSLELPSIRFADLECLSDLTKRVVESLP